GKSQSFYLSYRRWCQFADDVRLPHKTVLNMVETNTQRILNVLDSMEQNVTRYDIASIPFAHLIQHIRLRTNKVIGHITATQGK
ncbi:MAG: hypothetical protein IJ993_01060, partial [Akkermansia sp.]|nr:hypothetical protein [Akkermansia sp.]